MNSFNKVKNIPAAIVLALFLAFCAFNIVTSWDVLVSRAEKIAKIASVDDLNEWKTETAEDLGDKLAYHDSLVEVNSWILDGLNKKEINNFSILVDDGMMYYASKYMDALDEVDQYTKQTLMLKNLAEENGSKFLTILPPSKILYGVSNVDLNLPLNNPNPKLDKYLSQLQQRKINAIDFRIAFKNSGLELDKLFFKTDHQWTPLGAFIASNKLIEYLNTNFSENLDPGGYYRDLNNYESTIYEHTYLGTHGRHVGVKYSDLDNFQMLVLKDYQNTSFYNYEFDGKEEIVRSGNLKESLVNEVILNNPQDYEQNMYSAYIAQTDVQNRIVNENNPNGIKILVYRDSYFTPMAYFLAPMCSEINMYYGKRGNGKSQFLEEVKTGKYDYVILEVYPYSLDMNTLGLFDLEN